MRVPAGTTCSKPVLHNFEIWAHLSLSSKMLCFIGASSATTKYQCENWLHSLVSNFKWIHASLNFKIRSTRTDFPFSCGSSPASSAVSVDCRVGLSSLFHFSPHPQTRSFLGLGWGLVSRHSSEEEKIDRSDQGKTILKS